MVTKTGVNKGNVRGIPKDIDTDIQQILIRIINGEEEVHLPDYGKLLFILTYNIMYLFYLSLLKDINFLS